MSESCNDSTMVVTGTDARARQGRLADILDHYLSDLFGTAALGIALAWISHFAIQSTAHLVPSKKN